MGFSGVQKRDEACGALAFNLRQTVDVMAVSLVSKSLKKFCNDKEPISLIPGSKKATKRNGTTDTKNEYLSCTFLGRQKRSRKFKLFGDSLKVSSGWKKNPKVNQGRLSQLQILLNKANSTSSQITKTKLKTMLNKGP